MKKLSPVLVGFFLVQFMVSQPLFAQMDSIFEQGVYRTFIVHLPTGYNPVNKYPLVLDLHGLNSNASQQQIYSQFDAVADTAKFIVVYPNAIAGNWALAGNTDVDFISHLIDYMRIKYACNSCLFSTGMSEGAFMTYKLACHLPKTLTAIAVVAGNMTQFLENNCVISKGLPVMHFHGTADPLVNFNGTFGIPPVTTTIQWWVTQNNCSTNPTITTLPNTNSGDSSTVEKYYYSNGRNNSEVTFYKIINGGHTWPGAIAIPAFGFTNKDISASNLMGAFFKRFCSIALDAKEVNNTTKLFIYPNPANRFITLDLPQFESTVEILDVHSRKVYVQKHLMGQTQIDCGRFYNGLYFVKVKTGNSVSTSNVMVFNE